MNLKDLIFGKKINLDGTEKSSGRYLNSVQKWLPIEDIRDGVVITTDGNFVKILEVLPVNLYLKSEAEQETYIFYFASYLKVAPDNLQIVVMTQKANIEAYIERMWQFYQSEENENCKYMIEDNIAEIEYLANETALTKRFFIAFKYEQRMKVRGNDVKSIIQRLNEEEETAKHYLDLCGLEVIEPDYSDNFLCNVLYELINRKTSIIIKPPITVFTMISEILGGDSTV